MKVLVSGLINIETNVCCHKFPVEYEPIVYAFNEVKNNISGVAFNVLSALDVLGDEVVPAAVVGKDAAGKMICSCLEEKRMKLAFVKQILPETCTSVVLFDESGKRKVFCDLKNIQEYVYPFDELKTDVENCDAVVACNINFNDELIKNARHFGKKVFTDVHVLSDINDEYNKRFLENADVVFLSDEGIRGNYEDFLISIYEKYGNEIIVLGMGSKGAMLLDGKDKVVYFAESVHVREVVNTVGAGDSLFSCFVHYYMKGESAVDSLKRAVTFAAYKIGESGGARGFADEKLLDTICGATKYNVVEIKKF